mmetsp:Transcript_24386/g.51100  ORF Transcript_24386/g.51100 Transcript_24386/m.51100 type:complete len:417 (+) Transcript_24386:111-1361(+)
MLSIFFRTTSVIVLLLSVSSFLVVNVTALSANASATTTTSSCADNSHAAKSSLSLLSAGSIEKIAQGGVAIEHNWLPPDLVSALRDDARYLFESGQFQPDGLTNTARSRSEQGFTSNADRQTFRGGADFSSDVGDAAARARFAQRMNELRVELADKLGRPTLATDGPSGRPKHEMTYNCYQPGAKLGRHLDEHHEETKGVKGWTMPTRRSVTWLVYLNDEWREEEGGALRCLPREEDQLSREVQVGSHQGNLQVGWLDKRHPVFLDCFSRPSGGAALYRLVNEGEKSSRSQPTGEASNQGGIIILSSHDFDVPGQPIDFTKFLAEEHRQSFEQISTSRLDPRFANKDNTNGGKVKKTTIAAVGDETHALDIAPTGGTLVLFDSVTLPHRVKEVTGKRQRIAATGWFHEDSQFVLEL